MSRHQVDAAHEAARQVETTGARVRVASAGETAAPRRTATRLADAME